MIGRTYIKDLHSKIGEEATLAGWVKIRRDHGKLIFIDLRDSTGTVQMVAQPSPKASAGKLAYEMAEQVRPEWVIKVTGKVNKRPEKNINKDEENGDIEIEIVGLEVISQSETPPFDLTSDGHEIGEEHRLKYRYLDLRRDRMQKNLRARHKVIKFIRDFLDREGFVEIETPILTKSTPEGARDYIVPSRLQPGKFYALPQSPQQYKQLLMVGGIERYFQIARCLRDEDTRGDRQAEFTQLDLETSFTSSDEITELVQNMYTELVKTLYPDKKMSWTRLTHGEAIEKYDTDKPDLRKDKNDPNELAFVWINDFPLFGGSTAKLAPSHHMFTAPRAEDIAKLDSDPASVRSLQYDLALNGYEIAGGSIRIHDPKVQEKIFDLIGFTQEQKDYFQHILDAFAYGVPPHGGIASGIDRLLMILACEPSIREVIAFPKTGDGRDLMMSAPSDVDPTQLKELRIKIVDK